MKKKFTFLVLTICFSFYTFSQENIILDLKIKGIKKTKISLIKKLIETKKNTSLDSIQLFEDIVRLKRLPAISHAYFQVFHVNENKYNVYINVE